MAISFLGGRGFVWRRVQGKHPRQKSSSSCNGDDVGHSQHHLNRMLGILRSAIRQNLAFDLFLLPFLPIAKRDTHEKA